ncbi:MAG: hypothetical protein NT128_01975 [Proteobacteria bacterium]|nr:hypothetical protein [Pseudomonadota bacterium]
MKNLMLLALIATAFSTSMSACEYLVCDMLGESHTTKPSKLSGLGAVDFSGSSMFASSESPCGDLVSELLGEKPISKAPKPFELGAMIDIKVNIDASMLSEDWLKHFRSQKSAVEQLIRITVNIDGLDICLPKECSIVKVPVVAPVSKPTKEKEGVVEKSEVALSHIGSAIKFPPLEEPGAIVQGIFDRLRETKNTKVAMAALNKVTDNALEALSKLGVAVELKGLALQLTNAAKGDTASKLKALQSLLDTGLEFVDGTTSKAFFRGKKRKTLLCLLRTLKK